jgi:hypothetical protein
MADDLKSGNELRDARLARLRGTLHDRLARHVWRNESGLA